MLTQLSPVIHPAALANRAVTRHSPVQSEQHVLFQTAIESLTDGVLIFTEGGAQVYANHRARQLSTQLSASQTCPDGMPKAIEQVCQTLVQSRSSAASPAVVIEAEIRAKDSRLWVQASWLERQGSEPYLLVMLKDCQRLLQNLAVTEASRYKLTPREAQIWQLRRVGSTYQEIAQQLYISLETVRKHLKSIYAKQRVWSLDE
ncbi:helix-turn-helix transcriptional regulator [Stenomitos frigidus]|nr:helix-turn-helix transcriptional regulator [Stenomitos frigidus]